MTLISRDYDAISVGPTVSTKQDQTALISSTNRGLLGLNSLGTRQPRVIFAYHRPPDKSYLLTTSWKKDDQSKADGRDRIAIKQQRFSPACCFLLRMGNHAIVASNWHSWNVTVVTFKPSIGSFERQIQLNWMSVYCSTQSLVLLDCEGCDSLTLNISACSVIVLIMWGKLGLAFTFCHPKPYFLAY